MLLLLTRNQQNYNLELNLIKSKADFQNAKTYLMDLNRELNNMIILSPANGIIEKLYLDKGEKITKNSVVGNILGMENIKLISKISQNEINNIRRKNVSLIFQNNTFAIVQAIVGGILIFNAFSGICVIYRLFGANTCKV